MSHPSEYLQLVPVNDVRDSVVEREGSFCGIYTNMTVLEHVTTVVKGGSAGLIWLELANKTGTTVTINPKV